MATQTNIVPIIRTQLHRPPVTPDLVPRTRLLDQLGYHRQRPLTLVSAPAGYGKSTLVSHWLETCGMPAAWVSLDDGDNDLHLFLSYFLAALQDEEPSFVNYTALLLSCHCYMDWIAADLNSLNMSASRLLMHGREHNLPETIANKLYISPKTVKTHLYNIYQKLNLSTRREAAAKASTIGILK